MKIHKHRSASYTGVGVVSIPVILLIVAMTAVGLLSLSLTGGRDKSFMSQAAYHTAYYEARAQVEEQAAAANGAQETLTQAVGDGSVLKASINSDGSVGAVQRIWQEN